MQTVGKIALGHKVVRHVHDIGAMQVIVIRYLYVVAFDNLVQKVSQLRLIDHNRILLVQAHFTDCVHSHYWEHLLPGIDLLAQLENIESQLVEILQIFCILLDLILRDNR